MICMRANERADKIFETVWSLWRFRTEMAKDLDASKNIYSMLDRRFHGKLGVPEIPPAEYDHKIVERAKKMGKDLTCEDLAWFRHFTYFDASDAA